MPKYCSIPNCNSDSTNGSKNKSFYKFPLNDRNRLQRWLKNIGREDWIPSRHQYICHEHFTASCFKVCRGVRYLESDAVPTIFKVSEKPKVVELDEKSKYLRSNRNLRIPLPDDEMEAMETVGLDSSIDTLHVYEIIIDPSQTEATFLVDSYNLGESLGHCENDINTPSDRFHMGANIHSVIYQRVEDLTYLSAEDNAEVLVVSEFTGDGLNGFSNDICQGHELLMMGSPLAQIEGAPTCLAIEDLTSNMEDPSFADVAQVNAYLATPLDVLPVSSLSAHRTLSPDTVLSSALGSKPIASTLPIVSKHVPAPPATASDGDSGAGGAPPAEGRANEEQLEEHCYYRASASKAQLEVMVAELQQKMVALQRRQRNHQGALLALEDTVSQLRRDDLLGEERRQLLEQAYMQTRAAVSEAGEMVAVVSEEDRGAPLHAQLTDEDEDL